LIYEYGEASGQSWHGKSTVKGFLKGPNARTFVNVVQYLRNFGRFGVNTHDFGRQREDRILVAEEEIPHEIQEQQSFSINM
jgi:hypothetical protein